MLEYIYIEALPKHEPDFLTTEYFGIKTCGGFKHYTEYEIGIGRLLEELHCILGSLVRSKYKVENMKYEIDHILEENNLLKRDLKEYSRDLYFERFNNDNEYSIKSKNSIISACATSGRYVIKIRRELQNLYKPKDAFWVPLAQACLDMASIIYVTVLESHEKNKSVFTNFELHNSYEKVNEEVIKLNSYVEKTYAKK